MIVALSLADEQTTIYMGLGWLHYHLPDWAPTSSGGLQIDAAASVIISLP